VAGWRARNQNSHNCTNRQVGARSSVIVRQVRSHHARSEPWFTWRNAQRFQHADIDSFPRHTVLNASSLGSQRRRIADFYSLYVAAPYLWIRARFAAPWAATTPPVCYPMGWRHREVSMPSQRSRQLLASLPIPSRPQAPPWMAHPVSARRHCIPQGLKILQRRMWTSRRCWRTSCAPPSTPSWPACRYARGANMMFPIVDHRLPTADRNERMARTNSAHHELEWAFGDCPLVTRQSCNAAVRFSP